MISVAKEFRELLSTEKAETEDIEGSVKLNAEGARRLVEALEKLDPFINYSSKGDVN